MARYSNGDRRHLLVVFFLHVSTIGPPAESRPETNVATFFDFSRGRGDIWALRLSK